MTVSNELRNWPAGANNRAELDRLPEGSYREAVNLDPTTEGKMVLRSGFEKAYPLDNARGVVTLGTSLLIADGENLVRVNLLSGDTSVIASIPETGVFTGCELANAAYICTAASGLKVTAEGVYPWTVPAAAALIRVVDGSLPAGQYQVAVTTYLEDGRESSATPVFLTLPEGKSIAVDAPLMPGTTRNAVYCTVANGKTLYLQGFSVGGQVNITRTQDDTQRLDMVNKYPMPTGNSVIAHDGRVYVANGHRVYTSELFTPHLCDALLGYIQFPEEVTNIVGCGNGIFITADRTYFVTGMGTEQVSQVTVLEIGAVANTSVLLPDGRVAWMSKYGQVFGSQNGTVELPNRKSYAPVLAEYGSAGLVENDGRQMIVTSMSGRVDSNGLGLRDSYELEVE